MAVVLILMIPDALNGVEQTYSSLAVLGAWFKCFAGHFGGFPGKETGINPDMLDLLYTGVSSDQRTVQTIMIQSQDP